MPPVKIKRIKYRGFAGRPVHAITAGGIGRTLTDPDTETLEGVVKDMPASAGEERLARALYRYENVEDFEFRLPVGGARNTPGWKELDMLVSTKAGVYYAIEVDSVFTHRQKANADVLHDAIILRELSYLNIFPNVIHLDNDHDLANQPMADASIRRIF
jgi:hypothetical protein